MVGPIDIAADDVTARNDWSKVLSPREREIADLVARGLSNKEVARMLGLTDGTVKINLHHIFRKLGTKNRYGLIIQGRSLGEAW